MARAPLSKRTPPRTWARRASANPKKSVINFREVESTAFSGMGPLLARRSGVLIHVGDLEPGTIATAVDIDGDDFAAGVGDDRAIVVIRGRHLGVGEFSSIKAADLVDRVVAFE